MGPVCSASSAHGVGVLWGWACPGLLLLQSSAARAAAWQHQALVCHTENVRCERLKSASLQLQNKVLSRSRISGRRDVSSKQSLAVGWLSGLAEDQALRSG